MKTKQSLLDFNLLKKENKCPPTPNFKGSNSGQSSLTRRKILICIKSPYTFIKSSNKISDKKNGTLPAKLNKTTDALGQQNTNFLYEKPMAVTLLLC